MTKENLERFRNDNFLKNYYETDTDAYIVVTVTKENIYDQYSKNSLINNDFFDYLDELYKFANKSKKLNIVFDFDESFSEQEKDNVISLVKVNYSLRYYEKRTKMKSLAIISLILLLIGCIILATYATLEHFQVNYIISEVISIFSWVFIWEAADLYFFARRELKIDCLKINDLYLANYIKKSAE
ncbi:MAG: hypothetical protein SO232_03585 [Candidatus Onthovivens sp.]|nr:hypothetical protein [Candidatus Onthovivens sp.]